MALLGLPCISHVQGTGLQLLLSACTISVTAGATVATHKRVACPLTLQNRSWPLALALQRSVCLHPVGMQHSTTVVAAVAAGRHAAPGKHVRHHSQHPSMCPHRTGCSGDRPGRGLSHRPYPRYGMQLHMHTVDGKRNSGNCTPLHGRPFPCMLIRTRFTAVCTASDPP